jgi:hypothetical protein
MDIFLKSEHKFSPNKHVGYYSINCINAKIKNISMTYLMMINQRFVKTCQLKVTYLNLNLFSFFFEICFIIPSNQTSIKYYNKTLLISARNSTAFLFHPYTILSNTKAYICANKIKKKTL